MASFGQYDPTTDVDEGLSRHGKNYHGPEGGFFPPEPGIKSFLHRLTWNCETQGHHWSNTQAKFCLICYVDKETV
jgi:hypothetical protein